jgi:hypothetical protein
MDDQTSEKLGWELIRNTGGQLTGLSDGQLRLESNDFSLLLGIPQTNFNAAALEIIGTEDFTYRELSTKERESILVDILETIDSGKLTSSGPEKKIVWERGWRENLDDYSVSLDPMALIPKFVRKGVPKRLNGKFIMPVDDDFETNFLRVMREVLFPHYFSDVDKLYEFGCGTGSNLVAAAKILPGIELYGLDWSKASNEIIELIARQSNLNLQAQFFDMFSPDYSLEMGRDDAVLTIGALEQLGTQFEDFVLFLLRKQPKICLHLETMNEIYNQRTLTDYAAIAYTRARNYLWGFLGKLRKLEEEGKIYIHQTRRVFGSQFHEGYSFVAWSPIY